MYINYLRDRQDLGFKTIKDIEAGNQVSRFLGITTIWIAKKGEQTVIMLFSKEALIALWIFGNSTFGNDKAYFIFLLHHLHSRKFINVISLQD